MTYEVELKFRLEQLHPLSAAAREMGAVERSVVTRHVAGVGQLRELAYLAKHDASATGADCVAAERSQMELRRR